MGGDGQKAENNLRVIRLLKQLDEEGRSATPEEQSLLAMYTGWGDSSVLHHKLSEVVGSVTQEEWESIRGRGTFHHSMLEALRQKTCWVRSELDSEISISRHRRRNVTSADSFENLRFAAEQFDPAICNTTVPS